MSTFTYSRSLAWVNYSRQMSFHVANWPVQACSVKGREGPGQNRNLHCWFRSRGHQVVHVMDDSTRLLKSLLCHGQTSDQCNFWMHWFQCFLLYSCSSTWFFHLQYRRPLVYNCCAGSRIVSRRLVGLVENLLFPQSIRWLIHLSWYSRLKCAGLGAIERKLYRHLGANLNCRQVFVTCLSCWYL